MCGVALYLTIFELAVLNYFAGLKLAFVVTKFPQKERDKGINLFTVSCHKGMLYASKII